MYTVYTVQCTYTGLKLKIIISEFVRPRPKPSTFHWTEGGGKIFIALLVRFCDLVALPVLIVLQV